MQQDRLQKRTLAQTSPEYTENSNKKITQHPGTYINTEAKSNMTDLFSWNIFEQKLNKALDAALLDVARKTDLQIVQKDMVAIRSENEK